VEQIRNGLTAVREALTSACRFPAYLDGIGIGVQTHHRVDARGELRLCAAWAQMRFNRLRVGSEPH
jgi:hypothetical protein